MKIKEQRCRLCKVEDTTFGFYYAYEKNPIPICIKCIKFIKSLKEKEITGGKQDA